MLWLVLYVSTFCLLLLCNVTNNLKHTDPWTVCTFRARFLHFVNLKLFKHHCWARLTKSHYLWGYRFPSSGHFLCVGSIFFFSFPSTDRRWTQNLIWTSNKSIASRSRVMFVLLLFEGEKSRMLFCEEKSQTQMSIKQNNFTHQQVIQWIVLWWWSASRFVYFFQHRPVFV